MNKPKGGRGKQASYKSTHVRIPETLKERVEQLKDLYFSGKFDENANLALELDRVYHEYINSLTGNDNITNDDDIAGDMSLEESILLVQKLLKQKKSVKQTIAMLLTSIYRVDVDPKDL